MVAADGSAPRQSIHIYFGSQTGTAEGFAHDLGLAARARGSGGAVGAEVVDLERFSPLTFAKHAVVLLVVATAGEGEPTDNAAAFFDWLLDPGLSGETLKGSTFAVFGLGDRTHANFNRVGQTVDACMERLGARRLCARGAGDASGDQGVDFAEWQMRLWPALQELLGPSSFSADAPGELGDDAADCGAAPSLELRMAASVGDLPKEVPGAPADTLAKFYFQASRVRVAAVTPLLRGGGADDGEGKVNVELDVEGTPLSSYPTAGTVEVLPENSPEDVAAMLPLLGISEAVKPGDIGDLDCCITFVPADASLVEVRKPFPTPCSLREALTSYCDLRRPPSRRMLASLLPTLEPQAAERARRLLSDDAAMRVIQDEGLSWSQAEFWAAMGVERLDLGLFLQHCPRQRARSYTIASSSAACPRRLHMCVSLLSWQPEPLDVAVAALVERGALLQPPPAKARAARGAVADGAAADGATADGAAEEQPPALRRGLASEWFCSRLRPGTAVLARAQASVFKLPSEDVPIIMACAGAGLAPFRAFMQEVQASDRSRTASIALFFGCRHPDRDWLYREELTKIAAERGPECQIFTAFSRVGEEGVYDPSGCCGEYVQDRLKAQAGELRELFVARRGVIYVCGPNKVGRSVLAAVRDALVPGGEGDAELQRWRSEGRLVQEAWGDSPQPLDIASVVGGGGGAGGASSASRGAGGGAEQAAAQQAAALLEAVKSGQLAEVLRLIDCDADVNFQANTRKYTRIGLRQEVGETALHWAALRGDDAAAEKLLAAGANPDLRDQDGKVPLHIASFNGVAGVSKQLLEAKCDPNVQDLRGNSALHWVVLAGGSMRMLRLLLRFGADPCLSNDDGDLASDIAEEQGSLAAAALLQEGGAAPH